MTKDELLHRADEFEELGRTLLEHARLLRNQSSRSKPKQIFRPETTSNLILFAEALLSAHDHRLRHLDGNLFGEPAWHMLLFLFHAVKSGGCVTADQVCRSSGTFQSTARRWLTVLIGQGLLEICNDAQSDELTPIRLTELGEIRVTKILLGIQAEFLQHG
ncbi:MAG: hypothetical protein ACXIT4_00455 [Erythrobacter sp.]